MFTRLGILRVFDAGGAAKLIGFLFDLDSKLARRSQDQHAWSLAWVRSVGTYMQKTR